MRFLCLRNEEAEAGRGLWTYLRAPAGLNKRFCFREPPRASRSSTARTQTVEPRDGVRTAPGNAAKAHFIRKRVNKVVPEIGGTEGLEPSGVTVPPRRPVDRAAGGEGDERSPPDSRAFSHAVVPF